jgi:integrase
MGKKRGHGEGTVYKVGRRYRAQVMVGGVFHRAYFDTEKEARLWLAEIRVRAARGFLPEPSRLTLGEYLQHWLENVARHTVRPWTYVSYESRVRVHIIPELSHIRLQALKPSDLEAFYSRKLQAGLSRRSVAFLHAVLRRALGHAERLGLIDRSPAGRVQPPRWNAPQARTLSPEEAARFLEAARRSEYYPLFVLALATGMRKGELLGLRWSDVDLAGGTVRVTRTLYRVGGRWVEGEPKTAAGKRKVVLPPGAAAVLKEHRTAQLEARLKAGADWAPGPGLEDLVFTSRTGKPILPRNVNRALEAVLRRAGLPQLRFHDLRHSHATLLLKEGVNPRVVQERLGHSTVSLTLQVYSHVLPDLQAEAAEKLDRALFGR